MDENSDKEDADRVKPNVPQGQLPAIERTKFGG